MLQHLKNRNSKFYFDYFNYVSKITYLNAQLNLHIFIVLIYFKINPKNQKA